MPSDHVPETSNNVSKISFSGFSSFCDAGQDLEKFRNLFSQNLELNEKISNSL
jgi:hypothetical protein